MAKGTTFGGLHSHTDLNLIQQKVDVQPAEPKLNLVDIPGADGAKDLSEQPAGRVVYKTRKITWTFALYPGDSWDEKQSQVSNALNGRNCLIELDSDPGYCYWGRIIVKNYKKDGLLRQITVEATCQPYKLKKQETVVSAGLSTDFMELSLENDRKTVVPIITVDVETILRWKGNTYTVPAGSHKALNIELTEGTNTLEAKATSGSGAITVVYQEGSL